jgi:hypothetical protein
MKNSLRKRLLLLCLILGLPTVALCDMRGDYYGWGGGGFGAGGYGFLAFAWAYDFHVSVDTVAPSGWVEGHEAGDYGFGIQL